MRDKNLIFSDEQVLTATAESTNVIVVPAKKIVNDLYLEVSVQTALTSSGSSTLVIALQSDTTAAFGSPTTVVTTAAIAKASLTTNTVVYLVKIPPSALEGFLRIYYTVAVADFTAGTISAYLTDAPAIAA